MSEIIINKEKCTSCSLCQKVCKFGAIEIHNKKAYINSNCTYCKSCITECKFQAIDFVEEKIKGTVGEFDNYSGIWVYCEYCDGNIEDVAYELLGESKRLASILSVPVSAVLIGNNVEKCINELFYNGADIVYAIDNPLLEYFNDESYSEILTQLIQFYRPEIILFGATTYGRSLAPRIASRLNTGLTADCTKLDIEIESGLLLQTRPAFGGNLMATIKNLNIKPQMCTVRPKIMKPLSRNTEVNGTVIYPDYKLPKKIKTVVKSIVKADNELSNLANTDIIVSVGRGIGKKENLKLVEDFAKLIGGAIGASRAIVDSGIIDYPYQIGQTGKTVAPKIYFALGISGAVQHIAGMSSSDTIVAINKDPNAPIFELANYGIVGDIMEVLPELIKQIKTEKFSIKL